MAEDSPLDEAGFPQYRRTADGRHAYRIESASRFTEIQAVGRCLLVHRVEATAYPEMVRIHEILQGDGGRYLPMEEVAWEALRARCE